MRDSIVSGAIFMKDGTRLPDGARIETEPYISGWRSVKSLDGYGMDRRVREAGWTFFCLAEVKKASALGLEGPATIRQAVRRILVRLKLDKSNCVEITRIVAKSFLGVPYVVVSARSRHIQESMFLFQTKDPHDWQLKKAYEDTGSAATPATRPDPARIKGASPLPSAPEIVNR